MQQLKKSLAPIVLFVYNRPHHTLMTLNSILKNDLSNYSRIYIYADGPKTGATEDELKKIKEVRTLIKSRIWGNETIIIESEFNKGLAQSIIDGVSFVTKKHNKAIILEDDILISEWFLDYMNQALTIYADEEHVMHINGYLPPIEGTLSNFFFTQLMQCWGWGTWYRAWDKFTNDTEYLYSQIKITNGEKSFDGNTHNFFINQLKDNISRKKNTWAIKWYATIFLNRGYCLSPNVSLTQNIGSDGSGKNCKIDKIFNTTIALNQYHLIKLPKIKIDVNAEAMLFKFYRKSNSFHHKISRFIRNKLHFSIHSL